MAIEDHLRNMEAARAAQWQHDHQEQLRAQATVGPAHQLLRQLSQEAFRLLMPRNQGRALEVALVNRLGYAAVDTGRSVWILPSPQSVGWLRGFGFLDDGTLVHTPRFSMPQWILHGKYSQADRRRVMKRVERRVDSAVRGAGCVVPIATAIPAVVEAAPPRQVDSDYQPQARAFVLGNDGRLRFGYAGFLADVETELARSIFEGVVETRW